MIAIASLVLRPQEAIVTVRAATTVSALFTAPAQKKRGRDEASAGRGDQAKGTASDNTEVRDLGGAAAEREPPAKRLAMTALPSASTADAVTSFSGVPSTLGIPAPVSSQETAPAQGVASDNPGVSAAAAGAAASGVNEDSGADDGAEAGNGLANESVSFTDLPFPPEHYVATIAELQVHEFPLPETGRGGELVCPAGYVATRRKTRCAP